MNCNPQWLLWNPRRRTSDNWLLGIRWRSWLLGSRRRSCLLGIRWRSWLLVIRRRSCLLGIRLSRTQRSKYIIEGLCFSISIWRWSFRCCWFACAVLCFCWSESSAVWGRGPGKDLTDPILPQKAHCFGYYGKPTCRWPFQRQTHTMKENATCHVPPHLARQPDELPCRTRHAEQQSNDVILVF
jgi:hypothetical protein